ncbi:hypothetical protein [Chitinophaga tropicalis]|uniref:Uncharacterized protein n=1 Tax=Chitinophaga tropicalis TaxID=2683588 RepID=A0A7K1U1U4_9BACT|nr:hypothetical protein [Chitinophaga tropicalis]MVT08313.1 hypothetical protein [Chitinophaga tropicalis]
MAFQITYRRLAAVNILHSFYLDEEGKVFYGLPAAAQEERLGELMMDNRYRLIDDLVITPVASTEKIMKGQKIVFRQTPLGIILGVATGSDLQPTVPLNAQLRLQFIIRLKQSSLISRSNLRVNPVTPACYYFTNDSLVAGKTFPSLSAPIQDFANGRIYEMGETAVVGGTTSQAISRTSSAATGWAATDDFHCISEYDRILLPRKFRYRFEPADIVKASFSLQKAGDEIKALLFEKPVPMKEVTLNFAAVPNGLYTLVITGTNGYTRTYTVNIQDDLYQADAWGVLDLVMNTADAGFQLTDANGTLVAAAPVFELRFANRSTYWKYYLQKSDPAAEADWDIVTPAPPGMKKVIISKQPYPLMKAYRKVSYGTIPLPNPDGENLSRQGDLICSEIMLPKMKL